MSKKQKTYEQGVEDGIAKALNAVRKWCKQEEKRFNEDMKLYAKKLEFETALDLKSTKDTYAIIAMLIDEGIGPVDFLK